jgi:hypothetical protein
MIYAGAPEIIHLPFFVIDFLLALFDVDLVSRALGRCTFNFALLNFDGLRVTLVFCPRRFKVTLEGGDLSGCLNEFLFQLMVK